MALDLTPKSLRREIEAALKLRRDHTARSQSLIRQYAEGARESWSNPEPTFENHCFEWAVNIVPNLVFTNPTVRVTDQGVQDEQTAAIQVGMRSLVRQTRLNYDLTAIAYDLQFDFGCGLVLMEPTPGRVDEQGNPINDPMFTAMRPRFKRLSPRQVFRDSRAPEIGAPRFEGHIIVKDLRDMQTETTVDENGQVVLKYDQAALAELTTDGGLDEIRRDMMQDGIYLPERGENGQVVAFEVYVPDANGTGMWLTLGWGSGDDAKFLRAEREYRGPTGGCYCWWGFYVIPDQVYPLAPLAVTRKQVEEINKHRWQASRDAGVAKQIGVINGAAPGTVANIQDARSGDILSIPGFTGILNTLKFGGAMPETYEYVDWSQGKLDRLSGLTEMQRGNVTGVTAREAEQASMYADTRLKYAISRFKEDTAFGPLSKMADLMFENKSVVFPITDEGEDGVEASRGTFYGGRESIQEIALRLGPEAAAMEMQKRRLHPWKPGLTVEIEPYSMEFVNQNRLREQMVEFQSQTLAILEAQMTMPFLNGRAMVNDLGETLNIAKSGDRYVDWQSVYQMLTMQMLAGQAQTAMGMEQQAQETIAGPEGRKPKAKGKAA